VLHADGSARLLRVRVLRVPHVLCVLHLLHVLGLCLHGKERRRLCLNINLPVLTPGGVSGEVLVVCRIHAHECGRVWKYWGRVNRHTSD
jgi:hypothetical protein